MFLILKVMQSRMKPKKGPYMENVKLNSRFKDSCDNTKLKEKGKFSVAKCKHKKDEWIFRAIPHKGTIGKMCDKISGKEEDVLSRLVAQVGGECNDVETFEGSFHCGLATALMEICFMDPDIGTVIPEKNYYLKKDDAEEARNLAAANCDHVVFLTCNPRAPATNAACSAYMTAALNTGHTMMFTCLTSMRGNTWDVLGIDNAKRKIKSNANNFIDEYGNVWYFCICKSEKVKECEEMKLND